MLADARMIRKIRRNICGRFVYRGTTGVNPSDRQFEIWDDTISQKTYHIPVWNVKYLSKAVFQHFFCDKYGNQLSGHPDQLAVSRERVLERFPQAEEWPIEGKHTDRFGYVLGNGTYLFPDFDFEDPAFTAI